MRAILVVVACALMIGVAAPIVDADHHEPDYCIVIAPSEMPPIAIDPSNCEPLSPNPSPP